MNFNNIQSVHDFVHDSNVNVQISFFGTAFLCKKESVPITFLGRTVFHLTKTTVSISIENLAKRVDELAIAFRDSSDTTEKDKKLCDESLQRLFDFNGQSYDEIGKSNFIKKIFIYTRNFFRCGDGDDLALISNIHQFKGFRSVKNKF